VTAHALDAHSAYLLTAAVCAVAALVLLIAVGKINPFLVLMATSLTLGLATGMPASTVVKSFETGVGSTLGHIAIVIALGTMLGKMMAESGGADQIALTLISAFGIKRVPWAMMTIGLIVGLPVFFEVSFVLLMPIVFNVTKRSGLSLLYVGLPMAAAISVVHGLVPPHPAALMAVATYQADIGKTILYALIVGIPTAMIAGPVFSMWIAPRIRLPEVNPLMEAFTEQADGRVLPGFGITLATILLPVALMLIGSAADFLSAKGSHFNDVLHLIGNPDIALLAAVLFSFVTLGKMRGFSREVILHFSNACLAPMTAIILIVGGGGGLGRILIDSGVSQAIVGAALMAHVSLLMLAWLLAALLRLAVGSTTVAMSTAAVIVAPIAAHTGGVSPELLVLATGSGALIFSHVNDGAFWMVKEYFNMTVTQTMKTWSVCETLIAVVSMAFTLVLARLI
jgi:gluconate:H+ symporter, GntP family